MFVGDFNSKLEAFGCAKKNISGSVLKNIQSHLNLTYSNNDEHTHLDKRTGNTDQAFFKESRVVGQIYHEGMDESGILPKARYAMTIGHCLEQQGAWGCCKPPVGPGQSPGGGPGGKAPGSSSDPAVQSIKKCPKKTTFLVNLYLCAAYKLKGKIHLN